MNAQTAVERELVLRLASLLWRLRRATAIETGLLQIQSEILQDARSVQHTGLQPPERCLNGIMRSKEPAPSLQRHDAQDDDQDNYEDVVTANSQHGSASIPQPGRQIISEIARSFLALAKVDNGASERIGRYETMLRRQASQILFTLEVLRRKNSSEVARFKPTGCTSYYLR